MLHRCLRPCCAALLLLACIGVLSGCANYLAPFEVEPARPGQQSIKQSTLEALPPPEEKAVVAVYRFRDQTGQYKPAENFSTFSTAVTQGATTILMRSLEESGWFVPIEREGLSNLLNERQIIQSMRAQHQGPEGESLGSLPPLLYAGIMLEGGVIGYDTNVLTGGLGARYLGMGANGQYRQDQVTIYLRAVSTQNGRVLATVHTTKTMLSQKLDGGLFRFVEADRLLENETGYTFNEPTTMAVTEAIDEAVRNLVVEGLRDGLWKLEDPSQAAELYAAYDRAMERTRQTDYYGRIVRTDNRPSMGLGVTGGAQLHEGDFENPLGRPTGSVYARMSLVPHLALGASGSLGAIAAEDAFNQLHTTADVHAIYYVTPRTRFTPLLLGGAGVLYQFQSAGDGLFPYVRGAAGLEYMYSSRLGFSLMLGNEYPLKEGLDGRAMGTVHDNLWSLRLGLTWYPF